MLVLVVLVVTLEVLAQSVEVEGGKETNQGLQPPFLDPGHVTDAKYKDTVDLYGAHYSRILRDRKCYTYQVNELLSCKLLQHHCCGRSIVD